MLRNHPLAKEAVDRRGTPDRHYDHIFTGASVSAAFAMRTDAEHRIAALDADVIKTYVEPGLGVGIVAQMAYDPRDGALRCSRGPPVRAEHDAYRAATRDLSAATRTTSSPCCADYWRSTPR
jgi:DNA-binding transcriptional LysR family regulator